mmetsp:Transcript_39587/g.93721  ORF Transcript_39587/g.93721 Transcript_39587/m.93721 type:complete len:335 (-) Transcript_39587:1544-2548(-)
MGASSRTRSSTFLSFSSLTTAFISAWCSSERSCCASSSSPSPTLLSTFLAAFGMRGCVFSSLRLSFIAASRLSANASALFNSPSLFQPALCSSSPSSLFPNASRRFASTDSCFIAPCWISFSSHPVIAAAFFPFFAPFLAPLSPAMSFSRSLAVSSSVLSLDQLRPSAFWSIAWSLALSASAMLCSALSLLIADFCITCSSHPSTLPCFFATRSLLSPSVTFSASSSTLGSGPLPFLPLALATLSARVCAAFFAAALSRADASSITSPVLGAAAPKRPRFITSSGDSQMLFTAGTNPFFSSSRAAAALPGFNAAPSFFCCLCFFCCVGATCASI